MSLHDINMILFSRVAKHFCYPLFTAAMFPKKVVNRFSRVVIRSSRENRGLFALSRENRGLFTFSRVQGGLFTLFSAIIAKKSFA